MKAAIFVLATAVILALMGCDDNTSAPNQVRDQTISSLQKGGSSNALISSRASRDRERRDSLRVEGTVTAVDTTEGTLTIGTRVVQTDSTTMIERNSAHVPLSAIQVGDQGQARFMRGSTIASRVEAEGPAGGGHEDIDIEGTVTSVDTMAGTLTIGTTEVQTNAQTRLERNHRPVPLSAIQVGDQGEARIPAGSLFASRVEARG